VKGVSTDTEAGAVAAIVGAATEPTVLDSSKLYYHDGEIINLQDFEPTPRRKRGQTVHFTAASLAAYMLSHKEDGTAAYVDLENFQITVVINGPSVAAPGWSDHTARLTTRPTPEWNYWSGKDGKMLSQADFAEHVQAGLREILDPPAADMLELAQNFQAKTDVSFKSGKQLADGKRQLEYVEDIQATAGVKGTIVIPSELSLAIAPFEGSAAYKIKAWFRFRINNGDLQLGYKLDRPRDVQKAAFDDIVGDLQKATLLKDVYYGKPSA
jgi:uncharacterized protein YfdQ (DUF2303 family)